MTTRRRSAAFGLLTAAAVGASLLAAVPAQAAPVAISGTVTDAGALVPQVEVNLYRVLSNGAIRYYGYDDTDAAGAWTLDGDLPDGQYALYYTVGETAAYSSDQAWNGQLDVSKIAPQFSVTGGVPSATAFPMQLLRNAGVVRVTLADAAGTQLVGTADDGYGDLYVSGGYNAAGEYLNSGDDSESNEEFDGVLEVTNLAAGTYPSPSVYGETGTGESLATEYLNAVTTTAGTTTDLGVVRLLPTTAPSVEDTLSGTGDFQYAITGKPAVGALLTATPSTPAATPPGMTTSYLWVTEADIPVSTQQTYVPTAEDLGSYASVQVTLRAPGYQTFRTYADTLDNIVAGDPNAPTVAISGSAKFGKTVTASVTGGIAGATNVYQWHRDGAPIAGEDGSGYTITKADLGASLMVSVKSVVQGHSDATIPSAPLAVGKDKAKLKAKVSDKKITTSDKLQVTVSVANGASDINAKGKVKVFYTKKKSKTVSLKPGKEKVVTLPTLDKGKTTIKVAYQGGKYYEKTTKNIKVKVSKA
jgi:hypothetical protein